MSRDGLEIESEAAVKVVVAPTRPDRREDLDQDRQRQKQPRYHVVLWDDNEHTYRYVIDMLRRLFGFTREQSFRMAQHVDSRGRVICVTTSYEVAELKRDQIRSCGADPLSPESVGPMRATIEEADD